MDLQNINQKISELAEEYEFRKATVKKYFDILILYPFVVTDEEDKMWECLEMVVQDRLSHKENISEDLRRTVDETICDSAYRVYGEKAIPFLNQKFLDLHEITTINNNEAFVYTKQYSLVERDYHGYR